MKYIILEILSADLNGCGDKVELFVELMRACDDGSAAKIVRSTGGTLGTRVATSCEWAITPESKQKWDEYIKNK